MAAPVLELNQTFTRPASDEQIERTVEALTANGFRVLVAANDEEARMLFFDNLPDGVQIYTGASATLDTLGITEVLEKSGRFDAVRPKLWSMDRKTQGDDIRRLSAAPDYMAGSVHAVTEDGHALIASRSGSQLGPYVHGAGRVIWVVGTQKIVHDVAEGMRRVEEHVFPLEDQRAQKAYGVHSDISKLLIYNREPSPGRTTIILVKEELGF
jgi:hypothetical protein